MVSLIPLNLIYSKYFKNSDISPVDKRFITEVTKGTIRMSKRIDHEIAYYCKSNIRKLEKLYLIILRIGVYQINYMDKIPDYAIVSTSVDITKRYFPKYSKLTNALLRNVARRGYEIEKPGEDSSTKDFSIYYSHPEWLIDKWMNKYRYSSLIKLLNFNNKTPKIWFRYNKNKIKLSMIEQYLEEYKNNIQRHEYLDNFFTINQPSVLLNHGIFLNGHISVQSPTNGLIVNLLDIHENEMVLDLCAAPGSKTLNISETLNGTGSIISYDINSQRINLIKENLAKNKIKNVKVLECDVSKDKLEKCSKMIIDVPCSGTGTIAKNADLRWKKNIADIKSLVILQESILCNCSKYLKANGALIYSTCSIEEEENWMIIDKFLKENSNYRIDNASKYVDAKFTDSRGAININPYKHSIDGGFAVRLIKYDT